MIKTFLTFDYELYFGNNYVSEEKVLFEPTNKILKIAKDLNIKLVFFIDIMSVLAYKKYNQSDYVEQFTSQVKDMISLGHNVEFHFHPHWIDSVYENGKWQHKFENWSHSNLIDNLGKQKADSLFDKAYNLFIDMVGKQPICFRAGGYTVQPYEKELIKLLRKYDFKYDSSITPYKKFISDAQVFDFLECEEFNFWEINNNTFLKQGNNSIVEFPILSVKKDFDILIKYAILKLINKLDIEKGDFIKRGKGATLQPKEYKNHAILCSFDMILNKDKKIMKFIIKEYIKKFKQNDIVYLNILSHPKAIFKESLEVMEWYIDYMNSKYNNIFIGFDDI